MILKLKKAVIANNSATIEFRGFKNWQNSKSNISKRICIYRSYLQKFVLGFCLLWLSVSVFAQKISLKELLSLQKSSLTYIENYMSKNNWDLHNTKVDMSNYIGDLFVNYNTIVWAYEKNRWDDKAVAWLHLYHYNKLENGIVYQIHNKDMFAQLKTELEKFTEFKLLSTVALEDGLETRYRGNKVSIDLKQKSSSNIYVITIFNYKEIETLERLAQERAQREYEELLRIEREEQIKAEQYLAYIQQAQNLVNYKNYDKAKEAYYNALNIRPEEKTYIQDKIDEIDKIMQFLDERKSKVYDYSEFFSSDYRTIDRKVTSDIKNVLEGETTVSPAKIKFTSVIDMEGIVSTSFASTANNQNLDKKLKQIADNIKLQQPMMNGYSVSAKAVFEYSIEVNEAIITVNKSASNGITSNDKGYNTYRSEIDSKLSYAPMGNFKFQYNQVIINGNKYTQDKILKYKGTGKASNAFLSLLVPGLGDHRVSTNSGIGTAVWTYVFIGSGIGLKLYSDSEYSKYHKATTQLDMDEHYQVANYANQAFYVCAATGAIIWIYDIFWVWSKGAKNKKQQKVWKRDNLSFYYNPEIKTTNLTYTVNF